MANYPLPAKPRKRRTLRAAVLVTVLACAVLLWESVAGNVPSRPRPGRSQVSSRVRPKPPQLVAARQDPVKVVRPVPPPPPPPPPVAQPVDLATLRLSDIVIDPVDPSARFAVVDGVAVRAGESIGGHTVREVLPDRVLIGEESEVMLLPSDEDR